MFTYKINISKVMQKNLCANVTVVLDDALVINGITIVKEDNKDIYSVVLPMLATPYGRQYLVRPEINFAEQFFKDILNAYHSEGVYEGIYSENGNNEEAEYAVTVEHHQNDKYLADATICVDNAFCISGYKVINGSKGLFISNPSKKQNGSYMDICYPLDSDIRMQINDALLSAYDNGLSEVSKNEIMNIKKKIERCKESIAFCDEELNKLYFENKSKDDVLSDNSLLTIMGTAAFGKLENLEKMNELKEQLSVIRNNDRKNNKPKNR